MNNMKKLAGIIMIFILGFSGQGRGTPAWANPEFTPVDILLAKNVSKEDMAALYDRLNLTEKQRVQLEENRKRHHARIKALTDQLASSHQQLNTELERPVLDKVKIDEIKGQIDRLQTEVSDLRLKGILDVRAILTPEQYEIFSGIMP
ncbi:MAG: periplasmic heavy metal sensor [Candidatus Omnitrophota bacterium]|jgi:Spy/CpxP family protein refolding chaperone